MGADYEQFSLRFKSSKTGDELTDQYNTVRKLFINIISEADVNDDMLFELSKESELYIDGISFTESRSKDYLQINAYDEIYGNLGDMVDNICSKLPREQFELHWIEIYGDLSDDSFYFDGDKITRFTTGGYGFTDTPIKVKFKHIKRQTNRSRKK